MRRYDTSPSQAIKNYYDYLLHSAGTNSRKVAKEIGYTTVTMCNISSRLDQMTGEKLAMLAKLVGVTPGALLDTIIKLRKNPKHDFYFTSLPKAVLVERSEKATRA